MGFCSCKLQPFDAESLCTYLQSSVQCILCTPFRCHFPFTENYTDMCSVKINLNGAGRATSHFAKPTCKQEQTTLLKKRDEQELPNSSPSPSLNANSRTESVGKRNSGRQAVCRGTTASSLFFSRPPLSFHPFSLSRCRFEFGSTRLRNAICKQDGGVGIVGETVSCFFSTGWKSVSKNEQQQKRERNLCPQTGKASSFCLA